MKEQRCPSPGSSVSRQAKTFGGKFGWLAAMEIQLRDAETIAKKEG